METASGKPGFRRVENWWAWLLEQWSEKNHASSKLETNAESPNMAETTQAQFYPQCLYERLEKNRQMHDQQEPCCQSDAGKTVRFR